jgi:hypothetical protein
MRMANYKDAALKRSTLFVVIGSIMFQLFLLGEHLDNSVLGTYAPEALDANGYTERATLWRLEGFNAAFGDAFRMPGYPFLIMIFEFLFPNHPYFFMRLFQLLAVSVSVGIIKITIQKILGLRIAVGLSLVYLLLPIWHFVPTLIAESISSVIVVGIVSSLLLWDFKKDYIISTLVVGILVSIAIYLKPNHVILLPIVISFFLVARVKKRWQASVGVAAIVGILLLPWVVYVNMENPNLRSLTSTSGVNLYVGTGMILDYNGGALADSAMRWGVDPKSNPDDVLDFTEDQGWVEKNQIYTKKGREIWGERPYKVFRFGIDKILVAFGAKSNSLFDYFFGAFNAVTLLAAASLLFIRNFRGIAVTTIFTIFLLASQAFVFQVDRRFIIPVLFPFSVICLGGFVKVFLAPVFDTYLARFRISSSKG